VKNDVVELDSLQTQRLAEVGGRDLGSNLPRARNRINAHLLVTPSGRFIAYNAATSGYELFEAAPSRVSFSVTMADGKSCEQIRRCSSVPRTQGLRRPINSKALFHGWRLG
jgi:hypothetical protein